MKKAAIAVLAVCFFALSASAQSNWVKFKSPEGRYSVLMPGTPVLSKQGAKAATGEELPQYLATATEGNAAFLAGYFDLLAGMTYSFDNARDGYLKAVNGTLSSEKTISIGGFAGRQLFASSSWGGHDYLIQARFFEVSGRIYVLQHIYPKADAGATTDSKGNKFFDSFAVEK
jgi:hypothetical protein